MTRSGVARAGMVSAAAVFLVLGVLGAPVARAQETQDSTATAPATASGTGGADSAAATGVAAATPTIIDDFENVDAWKPIPADAVQMTLSQDRGVKGHAIRIDFKFVKGGGYAVLHRDLDLDLPDHYRFTYQLRGDCQPNNLEFKLVDSSGENVWWLNRRNVEFPKDWTPQSIKQRQITFAWGPAGGGEIKHVAAIEFAITAGSGGEGSVWIDELALTPLPAPPAVPPTPTADATSERAGHGAAMAFDGDSTTWWSSGARDRSPMIEVDFGMEREFGGVSIAWVAGKYASYYVVETSDDHKTWRAARTVSSGNGGWDDLRMPESEARWLRLRVLRSTGLETSIKEITIQPVEWGGSNVSVFTSRANRARRGLYPRAISGEQSYWTVIGADKDTLEALFDEDGNLEGGPGKWMIEPFVLVGKKLVTWADVNTTRHRTAAGGVFDVNRQADQVRLHVTAFALDAASLVTPSARPVAGKKPRIIARYEMLNLTEKPLTATLVLAIRPFQVNPPAQMLNNPGGVGRITSVERAGRRVTVNKDGGFVTLTDPTGFGASTFDQGDIVERIAAGRMPSAASVRDPQGLGSAALLYRVQLQPGGELKVPVLIALHESPARLPLKASENELDEARASTVEMWQQAFGGIGFGRRYVAAPEPGEDTTAKAIPLDRAMGSLAPTLRAILVNRDGAAIQPGSRAYARSWIRDGALTSSALLRLGRSDVVRDFIEWFAPYQYADGKVPCCVDARGSDPVPENDSHGEFVFLVAEYVRYTHDLELAKSVWPHVRAAAYAIDSLRQERRAPEWRSGDKKKFFGLLPPSISHEGYSAKPMHSYWDDLFALRGLKDAAWLAGELQETADLAAFTAARDEFQRELVASIKAAMSAHHIDFIPGSADLGDFDATSTTIALEPVQAEDALPKKALEKTFERYWDEFTARRDGTKSWDAYTPYELRNVGAFVRLGWRDRAAELLDFFMDGQRPAEWQQWPEVVWKDERTPHFLGDLPHTWVGSDYVRSALDMLAYSRERDGSLVLGGGVPWAWIRDAEISVRRMPTPWGTLGYTMAGVPEGVVVRIAEGLKVPAGGIVVAPPFPKRLRSVTVDGQRASLKNGEVVVRSVPAEIVFRP